MKRIVTLFCILVLLLPVIASATSAIDFTQALVYRYTQLFPYEDKEPESSFVASIGDIHMFSVYGITTWANKDDLEISFAFVPLMKYEAGKYVRMSDDESLLSMAAIAALENPSFNFEKVLQAIGSSANEEAAKIMSTLYKALTPDVLETIAYREKGIVAHQTTDWKYTLVAIKNQETNNPIGINVVVSSIE